MSSDGKSLTTKVVGLDDTFDLDLWKANSDKGARRYGPRNPYCAVSPKSEQIIFQGRFGDLIFISTEKMNTKVGGNFVPYNQDTEFALFRV
jgi:hypothetical protein